MGDVGSLLWVDLAAKSVIDGATGFPEVESFLSRMEKLGELFIFGVEDPAIYFSSFGFEIARRTPSNAYRPELSALSLGCTNFFCSGAPGIDCIERTVVNLITAQLGQVWS